MSETLIAGVMGHPIRHSLSPEIFGFISKEMRVPLTYRRMEVPPAELRKTARVFKNLSFLIGWNVTIPHKEAMANLVDTLAPEAQAIGAVNVVKARAGTLHGYNTDVSGVLETLREQRLNVRGQSAVIIGAGGAALSVGYALGKEGASQVWMVNRTPSRAQEAMTRLQRIFENTKFECLAMDSYLALSEPVALYANTTPVGMMGFPGEVPLPRKMTSSALAFDLIYRPENTSFLQECRNRGLSGVGGLDMLIWQAIATWEIWVGEIAERKSLKSALKHRLKWVLEKSS